jgi:hypothetical protein
VGDVLGNPLSYCTWGLCPRIVAENEEGNAAMDAILAVARNGAPAVQVPVAQQIAGFGEFSAQFSKRC